MERPVVIVSLLGHYLGVLLRRIAGKPRDLRISNREVDTVA